MLMAYGLWLMGMKMRKLMGMKMRKLMGMKMRKLCLALNRTRQNMTKSPING